MTSFSEHSCLVVTDREQSAKTISMTLIKAGIKRFAGAYSMRELDAQMQRELPHFVFFESDLPDASCMAMIRKLKSDTIMSKAIVLISRKPTKEEILELVKLKVAGIFPKPLEPTALIEKVKSLVTALQGRSPYGLFSLQGMGPSMLAISAEVTGMVDSFLAVQAPIEWGARQRYSIRPKEPSLPQILVSLSSVVAGMEKAPCLNLFDINRLVGKGRDWVNKLGPVTLAGKPSRRVVYQDSVRERGAQVKDLLEREKIQVELVDSVAALARTYFSAPDDFDCVVMIEPPLSAAAIAWEKAVKDCPENKRPVQIIATTALNPTQKPGVLWLHKPFGLDKLIEMIEGAILQGQGAAFKAPENSIPCDYLVPVKITGVDECGIVVQSPVSLAIQHELVFPQKILTEIGYPEKFKIINSVFVEGGAECWLLRLAPADQSLNRFKFWKPYFEKLLPLVVPASSSPLPPAAPAEG